MLKCSTIQFLLLFVGLSLLMLSSSCSSKHAIEPVKPQEIYDVIDAVIKTQHLDTVKLKQNPSWPIRVIEDLWVINVYFPDPKLHSDTTKQEDPPGTINYNELLTTIFSRDDSIFFAYQNMHNGKFVLRPDKFKTIKLLSESDFYKSQFGPHRYFVHSFSVPIFSLDHQKVWIGALGTDEYYLVKINNQWRVKIIKKRWQLAGEPEHIETKILF
jgi:hypothetical protein